MTVQPKFGFVVEYVPDVEDAKRFYEEVLGLHMQRYHPSFVQFDHFAIASDEPLGGEDRPELYWLVEDAEVAFAELSQSAAVSMELRQLPFGNVFAIRDPAGRPRFLLELARVRPSESTA